ncbi:MAG: NAD-dependent epimerase/dehydratase family protein [Spirochaeta sp.]|nr:NAD-dependent epimerase/dehydratase family protein [Spirochaeta sp.]
MKRKILLTGGGGFVAGNIISQNRSRNIVEAVEQREAAITGENLTWHILDLQDSAELRHLFHRVKPDVIIRPSLIVGLLLRVWQSCPSFPCRAGRLRIT